MSEYNVLTIRVNASVHDRLATEAQRVNLPMEALAEKLLKSSIDRISPTVDKQKAIEALAGLREIARNLPPVDAVAIAQTKGFPR